MTIQKIVNVLGATGIVGSNIVREALKKGYLVRGSSRHAHEVRNAFLKKLPFAEENLIMQRVEMNDRNSLSHIFEGSDCVFIACLIPTYFGVLGKPAREMSDAEGIREIVRPTVTGCLNIMDEAVKQGVRNVVICSSTSSTNPIPPVLIKNEDHWSNEKEQYV